VGKVTATITTSLDGFICGPHDGPGKGLGEGGERLHYWVFGGPWSYEDHGDGEPTGPDKAFYETAAGREGAVIAGRWTYEAADHWGGTNPFNVPLFIVTHRPEDEPDTGEFSFVDGFDEALRRAREAAGDKDVNVMGGAGLIRQAIRAGVVDELWISTAPVMLGAGKPLFDGSQGEATLEPIRVYQSPFATHVGYRVVR
jgi:dihydrofolate reductase